MVVREENHVYPSTPRRVRPVTINLNETTIFRNCKIFIQICPVACVKYNCIHVNRIPKVHFFLAIIL